MLIFSSERQFAFHHKVIINCASTSRPLVMGGV